MALLKHSAMEQRKSVVPALRQSANNQIPILRPSDQIFLEDFEINEENVGDENASL